jgi:arylsulfatase A-like enzyme
MFGSQGRVYKLTFYEEAARVPFIVKWKGHVDPSVSSDVCLNTPDIAPTLLGLLKLPVPAEMEGMDLSHVFLAEPGPEPEFALLQGMGHTYQWIDGSEWRAIRDKQFTYARYLVDGSEHLYDNQNDPLQMNNLVSDPEWSEKLLEMRNGVADKMAEINDEFKPCTWYRDHWMDPDDEFSIIGAAQGPFTGPYPPVSSMRARQ